MQTLGMLGGGQLGRMAVLAAARLGILVHVFCPDENPPAGQVAARTFQADYTDKAALRAFAETVDAITYEFENIPVETVRFLQTLKPVLPDDRLLEIAQHRCREKKFLNDIGIPTARWAQLKSPHDVSTFLLKNELESCILKTARFGYDGKGQAKYQAGGNIAALWAELGGGELIAEEPIDFACEISAIIARDKLGQLAFYPPTLNEHKDHILSRSIVPAPLPEPIVQQARDYAELLAGAVDLVGVLALEYFVTRDGRLLANEIAPRPHNSGHWTIDACAVSQFEQQVRTVCGYPVGHPGRHSNAEMINLIGDDARKAAKYLEREGACLHLYGKTEIRPGRKMGHVTLLSPL